MAAEMSAAGASIGSIARPRKRASTWSCSHAAPSDMATGSRPPSAAARPMTPCWRGGAGGGQADDAMLAGEVDGDLFDKLGGWRAVGEIGDEGKAERLGECA